jgi:hypothetical protein
MIDAGVFLGIFSSSLLQRYGNALQQLLHTIIVLSQFFPMGALELINAPDEEDPYKSGNQNDGEYTPDQILN